MVSVLAFAIIMTPIALYFRKRLREAGEEIDEFLFHQDTSDI